MTQGLTIEVDLGSVLSDRPASSSFLVRIRRGTESEIVAHGKTRNYAEEFAERLTRLLA